MSTFQLPTNIKLNTYGPIFNESEASTDQDSSDSFDLDLSEDYHANYMQITEENPLKWNKQQIGLWLKQKDLEHLINLQPMRTCANGKQLLKLNTNDFQYNDATERLFREITKLQLTAKKYKHNNQLTEYDIYEMKRRIKTFTDKWDTILWIQHYHQINNKMASTETIALGLGLSLIASSMYLEYYNDMERYKKKDLLQLFSNFNVYKDCILWWYLIMTLLKTDSSTAIWLIFSRVCFLSPHKISIQLLRKYEKELTRFDANQLHKITQQIVIGSKYPICAALTIAEWYKDRAKVDIARGEVFINISESYIESALQYLKLVKSDHLRTILLETKSDLNDMSPLDMAKQYKLLSFVNNDIIQRISTSIMNRWEFLKPINNETSFKIEAVNIDLIWDKLWNLSSTVFLTPLGLYITKMFSYLLFLGLFTALSFVRLITVYGEMESTETVFWLINISYILNEIQMIYSKGFKIYFSTKESTFDVIISVTLLLMFSVRMYCIDHNADCMDYVDDDCWKMSIENMLFVTLWTVATIALYLRLIFFCVLSNALAPIIQMVFSVVTHMISFLEIFALVFIGFTLSLIFIMNSVGTEVESQLFIPTMQDLSEFNVLYIVVVLYLVIGSLLLLTVFIAVMTVKY